MPPQTIGLGRLVGSILGLIVVLAATYYGTKLLVRGLSGQTLRPGGRTGARVRVLERQMVDRNHSLVVLAYDGKEYLLCVGTGGVQVVASRQNDAEPPESGQPAEGFAASLTQALRRFGSEKGGAP